MDWFKILSAIVMVGLLVMLFPRVKEASQNPNKGSAEDWMSFIKPMALVILFIIALIVLAR